ncbi:hypothetical protein E5345_04385 [Propionibacterium sp. NM47_B9-13]|nr:hypothetical protein CP877_02545 [Cutibacterium modestum]TGY29268.1 hypothetical protein E5345_04385 [Propionibacterium sp. NM47_B9-13]
MFEASPRGHPFRAWMTMAIARRYAVLRPVPSMRGLQQRKDETCCEPMTQEPYEPATSARW